MKKILTLALLCNLSQISAMEKTKDILKKASESKQTIDTQLIMLDLQIKNLLKSNPSLNIDSYKKEYNEARLAMRKMEESMKDIVSQLELSEDENSYDSE